MRHTPPQWPRRRGRRSRLRREEDAAATAALLVVSAAAGGGRKSVTLVWWHNANQGAGLALWNQVAKEYHAKHPDVTVKAVAFQNEALQNRAPVEQPPGRLPELGRRL